jgi:hypothetical protein
MGEDTVVSGAPIDPEFATFSHYPESMATLSI